MLLPRSTPISVTHLPDDVLPRASSTHALRVLPHTIALVRVMPVISYQIALADRKPFSFVAQAP